MSHPELILPIPEIEDPVQRFVAVVRHYMGGWHIKPPGVKKPLNPILGETYTCYWDYPDHTRGYYVSEQTSHHPPKSSYFFMIPEHGIRIDGTLVPRSKFLGNSAASMMEGYAVMSFLNRGTRPGGEQYIVTQPNMYVRGILFGRMKFELGDHSLVRCPDTGLSADIEFKTKGWVSGGYNGIGGTIKNDNTGEILYSLDGLWTHEMYIKDHRTGRRELLFDATNARPSHPMVRPLQEHNDRESVKLWYKVTQALKDRNQDLATEEKTKVEDMQRQEAAQRHEQGIEWAPRLFRPVQPSAGGIDERLKDVGWVLKTPMYVSLPCLLFGVVMSTNILYCSDGATVAERVRQILQVAPIIPEAEMQQMRDDSAGVDRSQTIRDVPSHGDPADSATNYLTTAQGRGPPVQGQLDPPRADSTAAPASSQVLQQPVHKQQLVREASDGQGGDTFVDAQE